MVGVVPRYRVGRSRVAGEVPDIFMLSAAWALTAWRHVRSPGVPSSHGSSPRSVYTACVVPDSGFRLPPRPSLASYGSRFGVSFTSRRPSHGPPLASLTSRRPFVICPTRLPRTVPASGFRLLRLVTRLPSLASHGSLRGFAYLTAEVLRHTAASLASGGPSSHGSRPAVLRHGKA